MNLTTVIAFIEFKKVTLQWCHEKGVKKIFGVQSNYNYFFLNNSFLVLEKESKVFRKFEKKKRFDRDFAELCKPFEQFLRDQNASEDDIKEISKDISILLSKSSPPHFIGSGRTRRDRYTAGFIILSIYKKWGDRNIYFFCIAPTLIQTK